MFITILSIITLLVAVFTSFIVFFRNPKRIANIAFSISIVATMSVVFGDMMTQHSPEKLSFWKMVVFISEASMATSWLFFSIMFARGSTIVSKGKFSKILLLFSPVFLISLLVIPQDVFYYSPQFAAEKVLFLGNAGYFYNLLLLLYFITSIVNLEATLRSSPREKRWQIKYLLLGVIGILGFNIFYYSHAFLYRSIDMNLLPVRAGAYLISFLIISFSILRFKIMDVEVTVSRGVFFRSLIIFVVGLYLVSLGLIGQGMRYLGPQVGKNIMAFLGFSGAIVILVILLSEKIRKKIMVFINKNFYRQKYDYREKWFKFTQLFLSKHSFGESLTATANGFKDAIGVKGVSVWLQEKGSGDFYCEKSINFTNTDAKPGYGLINLLENKGWIFNVNDKKCRNIVLQNEQFIRENNVSLIIPLLNVNQLIGFVVLREGLAHTEYNFEDYDFLKSLARQATFAILKAKLTEELSEAREMEAVGKVSSFIMHDLKNAASLLTLITQNAEEHMNNPEFQKDAIISVFNTSEKIKGIIQKLKDLPPKVNMNPRYDDLGALVKNVVKELGLNGNKGIDYQETGPVKTIFDREEIRKVVINLVMNAFDATSGRGRVSIKVGAQDNLGFILVSDKGTGMSKEFIETKLFKPFETTKKKGLGVGLYQCKTIIEEHSGKLNVKSIEGEGTDFVVYLPIIEKIHFKDYQ